MEDASGTLKLHKCKGPMRFGGGGGSRALSNLVPKYVVLSKLDRIPMLTVYEGRYNSTIFAQLTRACKTVMDHPHHGRANR